MLCLQLSVVCVIKLGCVIKLSPHIRLVLHLFSLHGKQTSVSINGELDNILLALT